MKIKKYIYPEGNGGRVFAVDNEGKSIFGYDADILAENSTDVTLNGAKPIFGINWGGIGTQTPKDTELFIKVLQEAVVLCRKLDALHDTK